MRQFILAVTAVLLLSHVARADDATSCPQSQLPPLPAPHSRAALADNSQLVIVALGSSSTQSWMSSNAAHSYPAILQEELSRLLPKAHVAVINRGIGGQDAAEELARLETDVVAVRPQLVIWQVGANGVLRNSDPAVYTQLVTTGVKKLEAAGADVILMDNQRSPLIVKAPRHMMIDQATADVAAKNGAGLFARGALMDAWQRDGTPYERFVSPDGLHLNDLGYRCTALALASAIAAGLGPDKPGG